MTNYRRRRAKPVDTTRKFKINKQIRAEEVRLLDPEGAMLGVFSAREAYAMAQEQELDLIEINPKSEPPVCRIMDYNKFKYQQSKSGAANKPRKTEMKTLRVSVRVSLNDLQVRAKKAEQFLEKGMKVKLQAQMKGREKAHPEVASETMVNFLKMINEELYVMESEANLLGDSCFAVIKPKK
jgi:translation initiation factor IF-3